MRLNAFHCWSSVVGPLRPALRSPARRSWRRARAPASTSAGAARPDIASFSVLTGVPRWPVDRLAREQRLRVLDARPRTPGPAPPTTSSPIVVMPMTCPDRSSSGPPLLPGIDRGVGLHQREAADLAHRADDAAGHGVLAARAACRAQSLPGPARARAPEPIVSVGWPRIRAADSDHRDVELGRRSCRRAPSWSCRQAGGS